MEKIDLQKEPQHPDTRIAGQSCKAQDARDRVRDVLRGMARQHWKDNPLISGGPVEEEDNGKA